MAQRGEHDVVRVVLVFTGHVCVCGEAWLGNGTHVPWLWDGTTLQQIRGV